MEAPKFAMCGAAGDINPADSEIQSHVDGV